MEPNKTEPANKSFAEFVRAAPHVSEVMGTTSLTGVVMRCDDPSKVVVATQGGQTIYVPIDAVRSHTVLQDGSPHKLVQLEVAADRLASAQQGSLVDRPGLKPVVQDPTVKETFKDPIQDLKPAFHDHTIKEMFKDPIQDVKRPWLDPVTTLAEQIFDPGSIVTSPATPAAAAGGLTPFVMATPHHAPTAAIMMQNMAAGMAARKVPATDGITLKEQIADQTLKETIADQTLKESITDHTLKELIHDTLKESIHDTLKEMVGDQTIQETIGGGTLQETVGNPGGVTINPAVWGLPGMLY